MCFKLEVSEHRCLLYWNKSTKHVFFLREKSASGNSLYNGFQLARGNLMIAFPLPHWWNIQRTNFQATGMYFLPWVTLANDANSGEPLCYDSWVINVYLLLWKVKNKLPKIIIMHCIVLVKRQILNSTKQNYRNRCSRVYDIVHCSNTFTLF